MKKKSLTLLLPSLLSGCTAFNATPVPDTTPPALVFVDGQIRESAAIIAHTQKRLLPPPTPSQAYRTLPYPTTHKRRCRSFGAWFSPVTSSAQADSTSELLRFL